MKALCKTLLSRLLVLPSCCRWGPKVTGQSLRADLFAGLTGAILVLPQGVAFALIAGLPPQYGLYAAMVPTLVAALFGSSYHLVSGPTTAISIVLSATLTGMAEPFSPQYIQLALTLTFLTGVFQFALGVGGMGGLINFVSHSVMVGFTCGAAVLIMSGQIGGILGVKLPRLPLAEQLATLPEHLPRANPAALLVALVTILAAVAARRLSRRAPHMLIGILAGSAAAWVLGGDAVGLAFVGALPDTLPRPGAAHLSLESFALLAPGALAVAMLGLAEAVSIAKSVSTQTGQRLDNDQEFMGQGLSNIAGSFFSGYASSGSFTRTGVNLESGAKTPMAAVFAALLTAGFLFAVAPLTARLPVAAVAGVLMLVALGLIHAGQVRVIAKTSRTEALVALVTFAACLLVSLEFALFLGVMLSLLFYLNRTAHPRFVLLTPDPRSKRRGFVRQASSSLPECSQVVVMRLDGSVFFGAAAQISVQLWDIIEAHPGRLHFLMVLSGVNFIDVTGCETLEQEWRAMRDEGLSLYFCSFKDEVAQTLKRGGFFREVYDEVFFKKKSDALRRLFTGVDLNACCQCPVPLFRECEQTRKGFCSLEDE